MRPQKLFGPLVCLTAAASYNVANTGPTRDSKAETVLAGKINCDDFRKNPDGIWTSGPAWKVIRALLAFGRQIPTSWNVVSTSRGTSNVEATAQAFGRTQTLIKAKTWKYWFVPSATAHEWTPGFSDVLIRFSKGQSKGQKITLPAGAPNLKLELRA
jgi:hypothetical protein